MVTNKFRYFLKTPYMSQVSYLIRRQMHSPIRPVRWTLQLDRFPLSTSITVINIILGFSCLDQFYLKENSPSLSHKRKTIVLAGLPSDVIAEQSMSLHIYLLSESSGLVQTSFFVLLFLSRLSSIFESSKNNTRVTSCRCCFV